MRAHEIELKLGVAPERLAGLRRALGRGALHRQRLRAEYFDTVDARLAGHGMALRVRREGRRWVQTAKAATDDAARRLEDNATVPGGAGVVPWPDPARHDGTPAGAALREALGDAAADAGALGARFGVDVQRVSRVVRHAGAQVELALDTGAIRAGAAEAPVCELELELKSGPADALYALAGRWLEAHGLWLCAASKAERGHRLALGETDAAVKARPPRLEHARSDAGALAAAIRACLEQIIGNAAPLAEGRGGEEHVHQLRVGLRRLRTALRELGARAEGIDPGWEPILRQVFRELGAHRDQTIVLPRWADEIVAAGAPPLALPVPVVPERSLAAIARDARLQQTLLAVMRLAAARADRDAAGPVAPDPRRRLAARLQRLHEKIAGDAGRFLRLGGPEQHRVRKRLKRLRYLSEFAAPLFPKKAVARYLAAMSEAQDELGTLNDERTAADAWRSDAERQPAAWFAAGWLTARQDESARRCEAALGRVARARRFWKKAGP